MSARWILRLIILVQALAALGIGVALSEAGASRWIAFGAGLGAVVLVRLLINANNFVMSARCASPTPHEFRLDPFGSLRLFAEEFMSSMLYANWHGPRAVPRTRIYPSSTLPPVLLVHGYGCNSGYWGQLARRLDAAGISHASLDLEPVTGDIDGYAQLVQHAVEALRRASGAARVTLVAHSMGGLVARAWMRAYGTAHVARVITLGTPHHGTSLAALGVGANAVQMRRSSAWLQALGDGESAATRALITSIYTHHDNIIAPQTSSELEGARNLAFGGVGHVALGRNPRVLDAVMRELARP
ncbi:triacylglycerol lipase [Massilia sp. ST3]|uniref:esterase/lipase family protein n=1 Tax=Massilia sp. ST3 TaxID=2824903 RepID=UPI001B84139D|nr:alpha/beta fold hydrolase [Massilia sp. ST3]MBQ5948400.1 alpha/beta fold hydrolase [Massilia sp. ST3]